MVRNRAIRDVDFGYVGAIERWEDSGLPAFQRFQAEPNRRNAVDACLHAWHIHEWLWHQENPGGDTRNNANYRDFVDGLVMECEQLGWVRDVADASKHRRLGRPGAVTGVHNESTEPFRAFVDFSGRGLLDGYGRLLGSGGTRPPMIELTDGSLVSLTEILTTVVEFWNVRLGSAFHGTA